MNNKLESPLIQQIFLNAPIIITINDLKTLKFVQINKEFTRLTGFEEKEVIGKTPIELNLWASKKEIIFFKNYCRNKIQIQDKIISMKTKNGDIIQGIYNNEIIECDNKKCILGYFVDITKTIQIDTKLKQKEQQYKELVEFMPTSVIVYGINSKKIRFANPSACKLLEVKKYEDLIGKIAVDLVHPDWKEFVNRRIKKMLNTGEIAKPLIEKFITLNNNEIMVEVTAKPIMYKDRKSVLVIFHDVSEKLNLEEQIRQAAKLEAVGLLAGGVAHDFNNILTIIRGYVELLDKKTKNFPEPKSEIHDYVKNKLSKIDDASKRAEALTAQLLAFSRKQILSPEVINLNDLLKKDRDLLKRTIREDIEISMHLEPELGNIYADANQMSQILMNLVINARDAILETEKGNIIIETKNIYFDEIHVERKQQLVEKGQYVMMAIADDGVGMDKLTQKRIFEPFFTTKEMGNGIGLGLSSVYGIVKQSGGFVWVYSEINQGTTFKIYFPRIEKEIDNNNNGENINEVITDFSGSETLLIVEDEKEVRTLVCETMKELGYKILCASNGIEALEIAKGTESKIDMMITDVVMPKMDGREIAVHLDSFLPNLKILYMSGYADNTIIHRGMLDPGTNFIQKPITPTLLAKKVREILDNGT